MCRELEDAVIKDGLKVGESLERRIIDANTLHSIGESNMSDDLYDELKERLRKADPENQIFHNNWEDTDNDFSSNDELLEKYGMVSIKTAKSINEKKFRDFCTVLENECRDGDTEIIASFKENGHGTRAVYRNGKLVHGCTRGRTRVGRDITRQMSILLPNYVEMWEEEDIVEVRLELLVSREEFTGGLNQKYKTQLSSVASLVANSAIKEDIEKMDGVAYKVLKGNEEEKEKLSDEFDALEECGFEVPTNKVISIPKGTRVGGISKMLQAIVRVFGDIKEDYEYDTDGIVVSINDNSRFYELGKEGNSFKANIALKMGKWESKYYRGFIEEIIYTFSKKYITPKARITPVVTSNGTTVEYVPLYNIGFMDRNGYTEGAEVIFEYGGETGVKAIDL